MNIIVPHENLQQKVPSMTEALNDEGREDASRSPSPASPELVHDGEAIHGLSYTDFLSLEKTLALLLLTMQFDSSLN